VERYADWRLMSYARQLVYTGNMSKAARLLHRREFFTADARLKAEFLRSCIAIIPPRLMSAAWNRITDRLDSVQNRRGWWTSMWQRPENRYTVMNRTMSDPCPSARA
jgi:hypothetical protein